ncbi:DMT family transporter [Marinomonas sp.]
MNTVLLPHSIINRRIPMAELSLLLTAMFWGSSYGITKDALAYTSVLAFLLIRFGLTSLLLLPGFLRDSLNGRTKDWRYGVPTGLILLLTLLAETYGIFHTTASRAAFLISLCILLTVFLEAITSQQWPRKGIFACAVLSVTGVLLLTQKEWGWVALNLGDYCILLAALLRACLVVATQILMKGKRLSAMNLTCIQANVIAIGVLIIFMISDNSALERLPSQLNFWGLTFYLVIFCTIFCFFAQNYGVKHTSPSKVALLTGSEPAFGALFAIFWLGETLAPIQILGGACILIATLAASLRSR